MGATDKTRRSKDRLITRNEAIERCAVTSEMFRQWCRRGVLQPIPIGTRHVRFRESDIARIIRNGIPKTLRANGQPRDAETVAAL